MKVRKFEVPVDLVEDFARVIGENELDNEIEGLSDDGDIIIAVHYEKNERSIVHELHDLVDDYNESEEDEEDDKR